MSDDLVRRLRVEMAGGYCNKRSLKQAADRIEALEAALVRADFLIDRINDWTPDNLTDENCTGWLGHVEPALTAYRQARDATR